MKKSKSAKAGRAEGLVPSVSGEGTRHVILHIDDDPNDTELLRAAADKAHAPWLLRNASDGEQAVAYLGGEGRYSNRRVHPLPVLILLDLKMPRTTGFEVLAWIRSQRQLSHIPVVVLSGSELQEDIQRAYQAGANTYLIKPLGFAALVDLVRSLHLAGLTHWSASEQAPIFCMPEFSLPNRTTSN